MLRPVYTETELIRMNTRLRNLKKERDSIAVKIATVQDMPELWDMSMVDWNDPNLPVSKNGFLSIEQEIDDLFWEIEEAKAIRNNTYDRFVADKEVSKFLKSLPDKVAFKYLRTIGCNALELVERVMKNPDYIKETYYDNMESMKWLPIVRVENNMMFVKTIRGIEPARIVNGFCNDAKVNDYALCKSVRNNLFVFDYAHAEVTA